MARLFSILLLALHAAGNLLAAPHDTRSSDLRSDAMSQLETLADAAYKQARDELDGVGAIKEGGKKCSASQITIRREWLVLPLPVTRRLTPESHRADPSSH